MGFAFDNDDVNFLDFRISLIYPFLDGITAQAKRRLSLFPSIYIASGARFAQYYLTRPSDPIIGKDFTVKLMFRFFTTSMHDKNFIEFVYAHQSNGQTIDKIEAYLDELKKQPVADFANDFIGRSWFYFELNFSRQIMPTPFNLVVEARFNYYLKDNQVNWWETHSERKPRAEVNGVSIKLYSIPNRVLFDGFLSIGFYRFGIRYETGYQKAFLYHSIQCETTVFIDKAFLRFWAQTGYSNDIAMYFKRTSSAGVALELFSLFGK